MLESEVIGMRLKRISGALCMLVAAVLFSGCGDQGWVRTSPDGQYVTIVRQPPDAPADSYDAELALYHIDRRQTTPIVRFSLDENSPHAGWVYNCQWTPDSRAVCFSWLRAEAPTDTQATPSENGDATPADTAQTSDAKYSLMLYEVASGRLTELPISVHAPRWSADGKSLMGLGGDEEQPSILIYRTDTWVCTQQIRIPKDYYDKVVVWDWAYWVQSDPPAAVVQLGAVSSLRSAQWDGWIFSPQVRCGNLYLLRGAQLVPLTTTGDVQAFWVDKSGVVMRWARVEHGEFLAVFERPLQGGAPRRLALIPNDTLSANARPDQTYYRFSPDGQRLAWYTDEGFYVLDIATGVVHTLNAHAPKTVKQGALQEMRLASPVGFDWRDAETLIIQRDTGQLELHSVRVLNPV
jgi:dipeptidyl aminopeptidase/acylaminoacyl peptidase